MANRGRYLLAIALAALAACSPTRHNAPANPAITYAPPLPMIVPADPKASLSLDQIKPIPHVPQPTTRPTTLPSISALVTYGHARDALDRGDSKKAITLLSQAIQDDPYSYQLEYDLGTAYADGSPDDPRSIDAFAKAAALQPDHLGLQTRLGRQYLAAGDITRALRHLRVAQQCSGYTTNDAGAAVTDFFLARALKKAGYDRAALQTYDRLVHRLASPSLEIQQSPELSYLIDHPELLYVDLGELYEKNGHAREALQAYQAAARRSPDNSELRAHVAELLATCGQRQAALSTAADIVFRQRASDDSLAVLADVCRRLRLRGGSIIALSQLHAEHPANRPVLFALADSLLNAGKSGQSEALIAAAWHKSPGDIALTRRYVRLCENRNDPVAAAQILITSLARSPDSLANLAPLWSHLLRSTAHRRLQLSTLEQMPVAQSDESARLFWVSRVADMFDRDALAQSALVQSSEINPPFAPAYRELVDLTWADETLAAAQKIKACEELAARAHAGGDRVLALELEGISLMKQNKPTAAAAEFARALHTGGHSTQLQLEYANAIRKPGSDPQYETMLWKLVLDHPMDENGYVALFNYYIGLKDGLNNGLRVLSTWLAADPSSVSGRILQAHIQQQLKETSDAEATLDGLFTDDPDSTRVLDAMQRTYAQAGHLDGYIAKLEVYMAAHPKDVLVATQLTQLYLAQKRNGDASRLVDATRAAVANDPDALYSVAELYTLLDEKQSADQVLQQVIRIDPNNPAANNDLGYSWAEEGTHLPQAEAMIRKSLAAEPDKQAFLDSLGWVLYKRGKFIQAKTALEKAIGPAAFPDPLVLDHLGDVLYQLHDVPSAQKQWKRSLKGLGETTPDRNDLHQLRLKLLQKLKAVQSHQPVGVAPI